MDSRGVERARVRFRAASDKVAEIGKLGAGVPNFEQIWYDFLLNYNAAFSQLMQASKASQEGKNWYSTIKRFRKEDAILRYLQHARNAEEHWIIGSTRRTGFILKPKTKNVAVRYHDEDGKRLDRHRIEAVQNTGAARLEVIAPSIRLRTVVDRGKAYPFPDRYRHQVADKLLKTGKFQQADGKVDILFILAVAVEHLNTIIEEAELLASRYYGV